MTFVRIDRIDQVYSLMNSECFQIQVVQMCFWLEINVNHKYVIITRNMMKGGSNSNGILQIYRRLGIYLEILLAKSFMMICSLVEQILINSLYLQVHRSVYLYSKDLNGMELWGQAIGTIPTRRHLLRKSLSLIILLKKILSKKNYSLIIFLEKTQLKLVLEKWSMS